VKQTPPPGKSMHHQENLCSSQGNAMRIKPLKLLIKG